MIQLLKKEGPYDILEMSNENFRVEVTNFGCTILKMQTKDKNNKMQDVVLGYKTVEDYAKRDGTYLGALVGRVANRIKDGTFTINNEEYHVAINNGPNSLHGGIDGFSYQIFDYELLDHAIKFHYISKDGEENYPGTLDLQATYTLLDNGLEINYHATSDKDTIINITNHSYFNLNGTPVNVEDHILQVHSDLYAPVDKDGCVTGEKLEVKDTPFDFNTPTRIVDQIHKTHEQLTLGAGLDHPFIFNTTKDQVKLYCENTGIELTVSTTLPQAQLYSANYLEGQLDYKGNVLNKRYALCIETQNMPDSIHNEENPTVLLRKGEVYDETSSYTFKVR